METLEALQARHRKEQRDLQSRITSKKKNATKKTRRGVNEECAALERDLQERQGQELAALNRDGDGGADPAEQGGEDGEGTDGSEEENTGDAGRAGESGNGVTTNTGDITDRLKATRFAPDATPQSPSQTRTSESTARIQAEAESELQGQGQGQGGKKRNRQKERMARRAAERETAAEAAEHEARGMTDHRGLERSSLERAFKAHGFVEHDIRPDGHCLFSAVADQLAQRKIPLHVITSSPSSPSQSLSNGAADGEGEKTPRYRVLRAVATAYMEAHPDDFVPFLEEPLDSYVPKIRDTAEWGGQLELLALAAAYGVEIKVVQDGRTETIGSSSSSSSSGGRDGEGEGEGEAGDRTIWLAYYRHGYGLGEHYNSLRKGG
ncbi:OTU domain-containing protein 6B [Nemania serpens]|nr:OTU domain-containing protein 6B [Nemania serpens]